MKIFKSLRLRRSGSMFTYWFWLHYNFDLIGSTVQIFVGPSGLILNPDQCANDLFKDRQFYLEMWTCQCLNFAEYLYLIPDGKITKYSWFVGTRLVAIVSPHITWDFNLSNWRNVSLLLGTPVTKLSGITGVTLC